MKKLILIISFCFAVTATQAQLGHLVLNYDSVTVIKWLKIINIKSGGTSDSLMGRRMNGNLTRLHPNQIVGILFSNLSSKPTTLSGYGITDAYPLTGNPSGFTTNTGTVTSIGLSSTDLSVSGSPITTSGSITANLTTTGVTPGTYDGVTVDSKGRITNIVATNTKYYNSSGIINQVIKKWYGRVTGTAASGQSIDISSAGFGTILSIHATGQQNVATAKGAIVDIKTNTTSAIVVNYYASKTTGVLIGGNVDGLEFNTDPTNVILNIEVTGY